MSAEPVKIGDKSVGDGHPAFLVAEIGINHNGDVEIAKALIDHAARYRFDAVKFQKRTVDVVYSAEELARPRESPFGRTNGDLKRGLEFGETEYSELDEYCRDKGMLWFGSPWDRESVDFLEAYDPPCHKVASALLNDLDLLAHLAETNRPIVISTGMSSIDEIDAAMEVLKNAETVVLHCTSTYPCADDEINLAAIDTLRARYGRPTGYSGHESSLIPSVMAVTGFDACMVERHVTLNRSLWGSDHAASLEPHGMELLGKYIRLWPVVRGDGEKRVYNSELPVRAKLRRQT